MSIIYSAVSYAFFILIPSLITCVSETHHKTKAATEKQNDLWCFRCDSMNDGDKCLELGENYTTIHHKCNRDQKKCQVRRISMSTSTEEVTGKPKLWLLQRNCSEYCEPGCIIIGERTKLHYCITCCDENNFCNSGSISSIPKCSINKYIAFFICLLLGFSKITTVKLANI